jgi:hypothetical protein
MTVEAVLILSKSLRNSSRRSVPGAAPPPAASLAGLRDPSEFADAILTSRNGFSLSETPLRRNPRQVWLSAPAFSHF